MIATIKFNRISAHATPAERPVNAGHDKRADPRRNANPVQRGRQAGRDTDLRKTRRISGDAKRNDPGQTTFPIVLPLLGTRFGRVFPRIDRTVLLAKPAAPSPVADYPGQTTPGTRTKFQTPC